LAVGLDASAVDVERLLGKFDSLRGTATWLGVDVAALRGEIELGKHDSR
jgi:hypothetical protein